MIVNIPHSSLLIPAAHIGNMTLSPQELVEELLFSTDIDTDALIEAAPGVVLQVAEVSRLVCDTERFADDSKEAMAGLGRGVVYLKTAKGKTLRVFDAAEQTEIITNYYLPYHAALTEKVGQELAQREKALIIDLHSFHHENTHDSDAAIKVQFCIGTDAFHTPAELLATAKDHLEAAGYETSINFPFSGSLVPLAYYRRDSRISSIMLELNRSIYLQNAGQKERIKGVLQGLTGKLREMGW